MLNLHKHNTSWLLHYETTMTMKDHLTQLRFCLFMFVLSGYKGYDTLQNMKNNYLNKGKDGTKIVNVNNVLWLTEFGAVK